MKITYIIIYTFINLIMITKEDIKKKWDVDFITFDDFTTHVNDTLNNMYRKQSINNLKAFNKSIIDLK